MHCIRLCQSHFSYKENSLTKIYSITSLGFAAWVICAAVFFMLATLQVTTDFFLLVVRENKSNFLCFYQNM